MEFNQQNLNGEKRHLQITLRPKLSHAIEFMTTDVIAGGVKDDTFFVHPEVVNSNFQMTALRGWWREMSVSQSIVVTLAFHSDDAMKGDVCR